MKQRGEKIMRVLALSVALSLVAGTALSDEKTGNAFPVDAALYAQMVRTPPILRDGILDARMNTVVLCRGVVRSIMKKERYKRKFCIVLADPEAERHSLMFRYYLFIEKKDSIAMLREGVTLEFTGQLMAYTPATTYRTSYILDILFEQGAVLVE